MTPTLRGRIETRIFLLATVGVIWIALITPVLPVPAGVPLHTLYGITYKALGIIAAAGVGWEFIYHGLQQFRWNKDWPSLFGLLTMLNEGIVSWWLLHVFNIIPGPDGWSSPLRNAYLVLFVTTWVVVWLFMQGPIRVVVLRWRFEGGRLRF